MHRLSPIPILLTLLLAPACRPAGSSLREVQPLALSYTAYAYFHPSEILVGKDDAAQALLREGGRSRLLSEALIQAWGAYTSRAYCDVWPPRFADLDELEHSSLCDCKDFGPRGPVRLHSWSTIDTSKWDLVDEGSVFRLISRSAGPTSLAPEHLGTIRDTAARVLGEARLMDIMWHNNQVLDVVEAAKDHGFLTDPESWKEDERFVLLHFDTHSDLYVDEDLADNAESIGDYVNVLVTKGVVKEVYWILPDWTRRQEAEHILWGDDALGEVDEDTPYTNGPRLLELYLDEEGRLGFGKPLSEEVTVTRVIPYHRITLAELPSLRDVRTFLDFDADYVGNTGYETDGCINFNPSTEELYRSLEAVFSKLDDVGARPEIATLSLSPGFTPDEDAPVIEAFFQDVIALTGHRDHLIGYRHANEDGIVKGSRNIVRKGDLYDAFYALAVIDAHSTHPDGAIPLGEDQQEYRKALEGLGSAARALGKRPAELAGALDLLDGEPDRFIDIVSLESRVYTADLEAEAREYFRMRRSSE